MPPSVESSLNWDFTPVINLLRSPTYGSGDSSIPTRHLESHPVESSSGETSKNVTDTTGAQTQNVNNTNIGPPRLGDFGSLWDFLGQGTSSLATPKAAKVVPDHHDPEATPTQQSFKPSTAVKILKRSSSKTPDSEHITQTPSRTPAKPIPVSSKPKVRTFQSKAEAGLGTNKTPNHNSYDVSSSESNAELESDVFDPPLARKRGVLSLVPSQVAAPAGKNEPCDTPPSSFDELEGCFPPETIKNLPVNGPIRVQSIAYKTSTERRIGLLTKLLKKFPDYAEIVSQNGRPTNAKSRKASSRPIHVFVDMSNIMVGFHDSVKVSRNIPIKTRIRRLPLSFQNFSLILERGRPFAKRVLVGSDRFAAINEGEQLGYEANILDRVQKVKHSTRRQVKTRKSARGDSHEAAGSSSETNEVPGWVEQGVDEILHLKILESLLDTDEPATIVLATGDAAVAEYSGGFMKMVERALQRGWSVELVSFSQVTSYAYRKKEFRAKWGNRFKMIALDEYIEELLDM